MNTVIIAIVCLLLGFPLGYVLARFVRLQPTQRAVPAYTINTSTYVSPNYDSRPSGTAVSAIVIHTTEGAWDSDAEWLCNPQPNNPDQRVSTHYVIPPSGTTVYQLVTPAKRAWHAGQSSYNGRENWNNFSIGVEISHAKGGAWAPGQKDLAAALCRDLIAQYHIAQTNVAAHRWVATPAGRKFDPSDFSDSELSAWIASLYGPSYFPVIATAPCAVLTGPAPDAPLAAGPNTGQTWLMPGDTVNCDSINAGWAHVSDSPTTAPGIGFVNASYVRRA